jgi:hypothetical protein
MREVPFVPKADDLALATSHLAQSSSASRVTAAQAGFFILSQSGEGRSGRGESCALLSKPSLQFPCGIFVTLGKCFRPITLLGDFAVRMSQSEHVGACAWASRQFY